MKYFFKGAKEGMKLFGESISSVINFMLLATVYFIGVGFSSLLKKAFKKNLFELKITDQKTYWSDLNLKKNRNKKIL